VVAQNPSAGAVPAQLKEWLDGTTLPCGTDFLGSGLVGLRLCHFRFLAVSILAAGLGAGLAECSIFEDIDARLSEFHGRPITRVIAVLGYPQSEVSVDGSIGGCMRYAEKLRPYRQADSKRGGRNRAGRAEAAVAPPKPAARRACCAVPPMPSDP